MTLLTKNSEFGGDWLTSVTPNYFNVEIFYYEELETLAGHPERRGNKGAEHMDHDNFRAAVECAAEHPDEWTQSPVPATTLSESMSEDDAWDSGIEI